MFSNELSLAEPSVRTATTLGVASGSFGGDLLSSAGRQQTGCGEPINLSQIYRNSSYVLTQDARTWEEAQNEALRLGGNLVTINNAAEQAWLESTFGSQETLWTGLTDQEAEGTFRWVSGEELSYSNWAEGQPVTDPFAFVFAEAEDYATLNFEDTAQWADSAGGKRYRGIIEIPLTPKVLPDIEVVADNALAPDKQGVEESGDNGSEPLINAVPIMGPEQFPMPDDATLRDAVVYDGSPTQPNLFLTFDDGPVESQSLEILDVLDDHGAKASFFLMGQQVESFPTEAQAIAQAGHALGNHTLSHPENPNEEGILDGLFGLPQATVQQELRETNQIIERVTGQTPRYFRPPYGQFDDQTLRIADDLSLQTIQWSEGGETEDWLTETSADDIVQDLLGNARNGQIFVLHDHGPATVEALDIAIPQLQAQGYRFATLDELAG